MHSKWFKCSLYIGNKTNGIAQIADILEAKYIQNLVHSHLLAKV